MSDTSANATGQGAGTGAGELPFENDAVLGLRRRIPTLAADGVRVAYDLDGIRLMRCRPSVVQASVAAGLLGGGALGLGALIGHLRPLQARLAWGIGVGLAVAMAGAASASAMQRWRLSRRPLLFIPAVGEDVAVPSCGRTIPRRQIRQVTRWVEHHALRAPSGKNALGWVRLTLRVDDGQGTASELVVATEMFTLLERCSLTEELGAEVGRVLVAPVREAGESAARERRC